MKPQYLFFWLLTLLTTGSLAQTIRRCNNNPGVTGPNIYSTIQAAHDASANGDIIYLEASGTNYGTLTCAKRLTIYGRGYFLATNPNGNDSQIAAQVGNVTFGNGSNNTLMSGMLVEGSVTFGTSVSGITVERSYVGSGIVFNSTCTGTTSQFANSCTIKQCFINTNGIAGTCGTYENNANRITIQNCILNTSGIGNGGNPIAQLNNSIVSNCVVNTMYRVSNLVVNNCLFYSSVYDLVSTTFFNCIARTNTLPAGNSNQNGIDFNNVYISNTVNPNIPDDRYQLSVGSPAIGVGINGTDVGAFGGPNPYVLSGQPPIPIITNLVSPPSGNNNAPLNVKISVRSNN
ncbi:MAG: hypothetical protein EAZ91_06455 [Cytophagales bacterium]|nr:MAG: hypothetical protein EAZ91_06455 [Cytophagales bacterium]